MNIKSLFVTIFIVLLSLASVEARDVAVRGYTKDNGTYVQPHHRSSPNEYTVSYTHLTLPTKA